MSNPTQLFKFFSPVLDDLQKNDIFGRKTGEFCITVK